MTEETSVPTFPAVYAPNSIGGLVHLGLRSVRSLRYVPAPGVLLFGSQLQRATHSIRWRQTMAYAIVHHFPGGTKDQYEKSLAAVHPSKGSLPAGQTFHAAGPSAGGWTIMAVHDSKESWEQFRDGVLLPRLQAGVEGGFPTPPQETEIEID